MRLRAGAPAGFPKLLAPPPRSNTAKPGPKLCPSVASINPTQHQKRRTPSCGAFGRRRGWAGWSRGTALHRCWPRWPGARVSSSQRVSFEAHPDAASGTSGAQASGVRRVDEHQKPHGGIEAQKHGFHALPHKGIHHSSPPKITLKN